jgi:hypothetical protein
MCKVKYIGEIYHYIVYIHVFFPVDDVVLEILTTIVVFINILATFMLIFVECVKYLFTTCH